MAVRMGLNGFGRNGRLVFKAAMENPSVTMAAINEPFMDLDYMAYLLGYDAIHGKFNGTITTKKEGAAEYLVVNGIPIRVHHEKDPAAISWEESGVNFVCESTAALTAKYKAELQLKGDNKKAPIPPVDTLQAPYLTKPPAGPQLELLTGTPPKESKAPEPSAGDPAWTETTPEAGRIKQRGVSLAPYDDQSMRTLLTASGREHVSARMIGGRRMRCARQHLQTVSSAPDPIQREAGRPLPMFPRSIRIYVKPVTGQSITLNVAPTDTVLDVKKMLYRKLSIPICHQQLTFSGTHLQDVIALAAIAPQVAPGAAAVSTSCVICRRPTEGGFPHCCRTCQSTQGRSHGPRCDAAFAARGSPEVARGSPQVSPPADQDGLLAPDDPRWNTAYLDHVQSEGVDIAFVRVGWFQEQAKQGDFRLRRRQDMPPTAFHRGKISDHMYVAWCHHAWASLEHPDPTGSRVKALSRILTAHSFEPDDVFFLDFCSLFQRPRSHVEEEKFMKALASMSKLLLSARIVSIILPVEDGVGCPLLERGWIRFEMVLAVYTHRVIYDRSDAAKAAVAEFLQPTNFSNVRDYIMKAKTAAAGDAANILKLLANTLSDLAVPWNDRTGFDYFCNESQLAWLRVAYVKKLASKGGPFPRRQELLSEGIVVGAPPRGARVFSVSHGWETEVHPSPSGGKLRRLLKALEGLDRPAADNDVVFLDFVSVYQENKMRKESKGAGKDCSAPQYFTQNADAINKSQYRDRTALEFRKFCYMLYDMGRLYAQEGVEVIVLPELEDPATFPGGDTWGIVNKALYQNRGWCALEFSIALHHHRIANINDEAVQNVIKCRRWPKTALEFQKLETRKEIEFTNRGDWKLVKFNFFKMTVNFQEVLARHKA